MGKGELLEPESGVDGTGRNCLPSAPAAVWYLPGARKLRRLLPKADGPVAESGKTSRLDTPPFCRVRCGQERPLSGPPTPGRCGQRPALGISQRRSRRADGRTAATGGKSAGRAPVRHRTAPAGPAHDHALPDHTGCFPRGIRRRVTRDDSAGTLVFAGGAGQAGLPERTSENSETAPSQVRRRTKTLDDDESEMTNIQRTAEYLRRYA